MPAQRPPEASQSEPVSDLAFLALRAATQLGRSLKGKEADGAPIQALVAAIKEAPGVGGSSLDKNHVAVNPNAVSLLTGALRDTRKEPMNTREVLDTISRFLDGIDAPDDQTKQTAQAELKDFCLALHSRLLAQRFPVKLAQRAVVAGP